MAAGTPTIYYPDGHTGIRLDDPLMMLKDPYSGDGTQKEARWYIATDPGFADEDIVYDSGLRENDDREYGDDWIEVHGAIIPLAAETTYHVRVEVRNTSNEISSMSPTKTFTTEAARLTATKWRQAR